MRLTCRLAPSVREVFALVHTLNAGLKESDRAVGHLERPRYVAVAPSVLYSSPVSFIASQSVGLNTNPGRSTVTLTCWIWNGIPSRIVGNASLRTVSCAFVGSTWICARTTSSPA